MNRFTGGGLSIALATIATPAIAQDAGTYISAADIRARIAEAERSGTSPAAGLIALAPYKASLEYRTRAMPAALHEDRAEFFVVLEGSGTLVTGGTLVDQSRKDAANLAGSAISDGQARTVAKGDVFIIPEKTAHWFSQIDGKALVLMSMYVPRAE
ncbi:cupin domain-containing protein [Sphingomonas sp.]|uniref:cupin domain-containing protein n=1 Tax=Sphingomonas sp. TaxID=28214 RepID=UPI002CC00501|nr:cupin domain-containing protein [Sphingomonas sp.]HWK35895.1 cupin domain-containing protein [Sphingomonas sp.]